MENKALSKKVLTSLLAMSCVYLGGTFAFPTTEAAYLEGVQVDGNGTYSFADGYTVKIPGVMGGRPIAVNGNNENMTINAEGDLLITGGSGSGTVVAENGVLNFTGKNILLDVPALGGATVAGLLSNGGTVNFTNDYTKIIVNSTNEHGANNYVLTALNGGSVNFDHAVDIYGSATKSGVFGMYVNQAGSNIHAKDKVSIETVGGSTNRGIQIANGGSAVFDSSLDVKASGDAAGGNYGVLIMSGGAIAVKDKLTVAVAGTAAKSGLHVQGGDSSAAISGAADISLDTDSSGFAVTALDQGTIDFAGAVFINKDNAKEDHLKNAAIATQGNSTVNINQSGNQQVVIKGGINVNGGNLNLALDRADSLLEGFIIASNGGNAVLNMANNAVWRVSKGDITNFVNKVTLDSGATVDLTFDEVATTKVDIADYNGTGGNIIMDTDLASEADGDKINITTSNAGTTYVQVKDASLVNGIEVTGNKNLLLITDASENINFVGKNLNAGGLWDVTPTIENGLTVTDADGNVIGTADQWYLTKIAKAVNNDSQVLLDAVDNSYALWRNTNDSLRKRLGELRFRTNETDGDGIWARYTSGKFSGSGFDSSYNMYQLGYDKADNAKSTYGFAVDSGTGHANYASGGGKDKMTALSVYGTWTGEKGNYTDVVARVGQFDTDVDSYGDYPDKASYKNRAYSLSVEYGKRIELSKERGTFIEPQAQLIIGRLGSSSYTTDRGTAVAVEGMNSAIARLGVVAGKKINDGSDIYFKASALHEFAGERDISMRAANGEVLAGSNDYGDTWFELGLGGNIKLGNSSHLYSDIERSFGADIQKKWQINAGVRFEF
ncbi:autotransporter outer membrane beta-barrel domain-containing protein [Phascolarctobacterium faecium]|uniref:autotransporter outer membrane beta-barrel domain-containing protein n=1 Tax=Phascolarctobacterium faecium TaxID=33025 RepID=UPI00266664E6|nr:autotransporter outer membrane beta-barrel domain-containing protein [Phascolarctobacterium faecium]